MTDLPPDARTERLPPLSPDRLDAAQQAAAAELRAGPRRGVEPLPPWPL